MLRTVPVPIPPPDPSGLLATDVQVWSAAATTAAVVVALGFGIVNMVQRRNDRAREDDRDRRKAEAQARLVGTGLGNPGVTVHPDNPETRAVMMMVANHSDRPIRRVLAEHWQEHQRLDERPGAVIELVILPGDSTTFYVPTTPVSEPEGKTRAWRIRWTDADGDQWCYDRYPQETPDRYTGQLPTSY